MSDTDNLRRISFNPHSHFDFRRSSLPSSNAKCQSGILLLLFLLSLNENSNIYPTKAADNNPIEGPDRQKVEDRIPPFPLSLSPSPSRAPIDRQRFVERENEIGRVGKADATMV